jgi:hypothetical protein
MLTQRSNTNSGLVGGAILIGLGLIFLLAQFFNIAAWTYIWPLVVIGIGVVFFVGMIAGGKPAAPLAIPGTIIGTVGFLLLFQNITGHWETWSYGWTIILTAVGLGLVITGLWSANPRLSASGWRVAGIGFVLFVVFGALFELVLSGWGGARGQQVVFPILLILVGLFMVLRRSGLLPALPLFSGPAVPPASDPANPPEPPRP